MATKSTRKTGIADGWAVKTKNDNGTIVWVNGEFEEITLHESTVPNETTLQILAANGIVPEVAQASAHDFEQAINSPSQFEPEETDEDNALSRVLSRVRTAPSDLRSEVRLHRVKSDGKLAYCAKFTVEEYDESGEELIRGTFGAGIYRVMVYGPSLVDGSNYGKFVRLANQLVEIEPSLIPINSKTLGGDGSVQSNGIVMQMVIERLNQMQTRIEQGPINQSIDQMEMFEKFAKLQRMLGGNKQDKSLLDQIREMEALKKFKDNLTGDESGDTKTPGMMDLAAQVLEILKPKLAEVGAQQVAPSISLPQSIAGAPEIPSQQDQQSQPMENENVNAAENFMGNVMLSALIKAAQRNDAIETHAPGMADKLPDEVLDILELPIWFDSLTEMFPNQKPALIQYRPWFEQLRTRIIELTLEQPPENG